MRRPIPFCVALACLLATSAWAQLASQTALVGTSVVFRKGHRIRVHVTSSHFPQFDRNPNTGAVFGTTNLVKIAQQTVYHDAERASHVLLPVVPPR
jgi:putative CocE/NonD family hydrolase